MSKKDSTNQIQMGFQMRWEIRSWWDCISMKFQFAERFTITFDNLWDSNDYSIHLEFFYSYNISLWSNYYFLCLILVPNLHSFFISVRFFSSFSPFIYVMYRVCGKDSEMSNHLSCFSLNFYFYYSISFLIFLKSKRRKYQILRLK